jgi:ribose transport system ATP-binding protein
MWDTEGGDLLSLDGYRIGKRPHLAKAAARLYTIAKTVTRSGTTASSAVKGRRASVESQPLVEFRQVTKQFGGTLAVDRVDISLQAGTILALLGENGAGKSTLIKMLAGVHVPDGGQIWVDGRPVDPASRARIAFIHQDLGLIDSMTAAENIAIVCGYPRSRGLISWGRTSQAARSALDAIGGEIDPDALVGILSRTEKSLLAIARALARHADVLVLDEPTASLPAGDVEGLFGALRRMRDQGVAMIYVTHRIDEVFQIADRVAVMRDGRLVATRDVRDTTASELIYLIVGRPLSEVFVRPPHPSAISALDVDQVFIGSVGPVQLHVMSGELVGMAGLRGAGHEAFGRALGGLRPFSAGSARLNGEPLASSTPADAIRAGVAFVTSNRQEEGLAMALTVRENLFINPALQGRRPWHAMRRRTERRLASHLIHRFRIRPPEADKVVGNLSGGNQQKAVLARWLRTGVRLLILEQPTMGVDVGAKSEIYALMNEALEAGLAMILVSSDLEEVANICNRAFVFNRGRVVAEVGRHDLSVGRLTELAAGGIATATPPVSA